MPRARTSTRPDRELLAEVVEYELGLPAEDLVAAADLGAWMDDFARRDLREAVEDHFGVTVAAADDATWGRPALTFGELLAWLTHKRRPA